MSADEILFFDAEPGLAPIYARLREVLGAEFPRAEIRVSRTQISFRNRHLFAMASLPRARGGGWPKAYLMVSFGLAYRLESPRVARAAEPYPNRWTHHVPVETPDGIDGELMGWLREAYAFSEAKSNRAPGSGPKPEPRRAARERWKGFL